MTVYSPHPEQLVVIRRNDGMDYPFTDDTAEPEPRYCWHCERETKQVRAESGGAMWWMCTECNETQKDNQ